MIKDRLCIKNSMLCVMVDEISVFELIFFEGWHTAQETLKWWVMIISEFTIRSSITMDT